MIDTKQIIYLNVVWMKLNVLLVKLFWKCEISNVKYFFSEKGLCSSEPGSIKLYDGNIRHSTIYTHKAKSLPQSIQQNVECNF